MLKVALAGSVENAETPPLNCEKWGFPCRSGGVVVTDEALTSRNSGFQHPPPTCRSFHRQIHRGVVLEDPD